MIKRSHKASQKRSCVWPESICLRWMFACKQRAWLVLIGGIIALVGCSTTDQQKGLDIPWYDSVRAELVLSKTTPPPFCTGSEHQSFINQINDAAHAMLFFSRRISFLPTDGFSGTDDPPEMLYLDIAGKYFSIVNIQMDQLTAENQAASPAKTWKLRFPAYTVDQAIKGSKTYDAFNVWSIFNFKQRTQDEIEFAVLYRKPSAPEFYLDSYVFKLLKDGRWRFQSHGDISPVVWRQGMNHPVADYGYRCVGKR